MVARAGQLAFNKQYARAKPCGIVVRIEKRPLM
jgi:hypothetical protein